MAAVRFKKVCVLVVFTFACHPCAASNREVRMYGKDESSHCGTYKIQTGGIIVAEDDGSMASFFKYDCTISFRTGDEWKINLRFEHFSVISNDPRTCGNHRLEIYDGFNNTDDPLTKPGGLCSDPLLGNQTVPGPINTTTNGITLRLRRSTAPLAVFRIIFTSFHSVAEGYCFPCFNNSGMCIHHSLTCDGVDNCIDAADEDDLEGPCRDDLYAVVDLSKVRLMIIVGVGVVLSIGVILVTAIIIGYFFWRTKMKAEEELHDGMSIESIYSGASESTSHPRLNSVSSRAMYLARSTAGEADSSNYSTPVLERGGHALTNGSAVKTEENIELRENIRPEDDQRTE
ncbi:uncharacterized protein [Ptychodera flava]|uniref:uncharacterized protein n=1 Tax=Ptychodera flava TaxID=63121 RepID=UPI003969E8CE